MNLFKKKHCHNDQTYLQLGSQISNLALENTHLRLKVEKLENKIPGLVEQKIEQLIQDKSLSIVTTCNKHEFLIEIVRDRVKELEQKKAELERAIIECDKALAMTGGKK